MMSDFPNELLFQLGDKKWEDMSNEEKLLEIRWCLTRTWANKHVATEQFKKQYYTRETTKLLKLKRDLKHKMLIERKMAGYEVG